MNGSECGGHRAPSGRNNRRSLRVAPAVEESAAVYVGNQRYSGTVLDESKGGLGVLLDEVVEIRKGARVRVAANRKCSPAVVVRCVESEDGGCLVGLKT